jgi:pimeloyl-ACP methyl ester carboxylesterase
LVNSAAGSGCTRDYAPTLPAIRELVYLTPGDLDFITPPGAAKAMQKSMSGSKLKVVQSVGHLHDRANPEEFSGVLLEFLGGVG